MEGEELTEQETALYDRQIRVWGADAQRRLSKAHVLVGGMKGIVAEFCKNIVLAGVGSVTLVDDRSVEEEPLNANFLIQPDVNVSGRSVAEICCDSLKQFNPMVRVSVEKGDLSSFGSDYFEKFDVVVVSTCTRRAKISINEKCRKARKHIAFYTVDCRDSCGEIFADLQTHTYAVKKKDGEPVECQKKYPSLEEALSVSWKTLPRRVSQLYFAIRVVERFEESEDRRPGETSIADLPSVQNMRKQLCDANSFSESQIPDSLLGRLLVGRTEFPPVCAVIGGILGQEVIKAISGKGDPIKNFFFFDAMDGKGIMEDISAPGS